MRVILVGLDAASAGRRGLKAGNIHNPWKIGEGFASEDWCSWRLQNMTVLRNSCNFAAVLRISMHGPSDLLSPLYDASRA
jgi:hypothetical protein